MREDREPSGFIRGEQVNPSSMQETRRQSRSQSAHYPVSQALVFGMPEIRICFENGPGQIAGVL